MRPIVRLFLACVLCLATEVARAQGIQVAPVTVEVPAGQMATTIAVTNTGSTPVSVQVRPFAWQQSGETDQLLPTQDLMISPPLTEIGGNETQTFRIVARRPAGPVEAAYRLLVDQIPSSLSGSGVQFALRLSIPVFLEPPNRAAPLVEWRITGHGRGYTLRGSNRGTIRSRLLTPELTASGRRLAVVANGNPYLLPQLERTWRITGAGLAPGAAARLTGLTDGGRIDVAVPVSAP